MTRTTPLTDQRVTELFWEKVTFEQGGCWLHRGRATYSLVTLPDLRQTGGHRYAYELYRGPIPEGTVLDHLCRNTRCVNPWHLEPVTQRENTRRGVSKVARQMAQTHCIRGHEFTPANTATDSRGHRRCRECDRIRHLHPDPSAPTGGKP